MACVSPMGSSAAMAHILVHRHPGIYRFQLLMCIALCRTHTSSKKLRWWCSVVLVTATVPLILLYTVWLPLTAAEVIKAAEIEENEHVKDKIVCCPRGSCYGCCEAERGEGMKEPLAPQTPSSRA